jgi:hypothetical protein
MGGVGYYYYFLFYTAFLNLVRIYSAHVVLDTLDKVVALSSLKKNKGEGKT